MFDLSNIVFGSPWAFILLVIPALMILWEIRRFYTAYPTLRMPGLQGLKGHTSPIRGWIRSLLPFLRIAACTLLIIALARPQEPYEDEEVDTEGIDIVLAIDISSSMLQRDFRPNRLEAAKKVGKEFVEGRPYDRIAIVVFSAEGFMQCPVTINHEVVQDQLKDIRHGLIQDGTAIGMGLATSVNCLKETKAESRVIILLTDGVNNSGEIDPILAADAAKEFGIRVYTIGMGRGSRSVGGATMQAEFDEETLKEIAKKTDAKYFHATTTNALKNIYKEIDILEKTRIEVTRYSRKSERFYPFVLIAIILLILDLTLRYTVVRSIP